MFNRTFLNRLLPLAVLAALLLAGCKETASETAKDVTQAREKASQDISAAQQDASKVENKAETKIVDAQQQYAETDADARAKVSDAQSEALQSTAKADFDVAVAEAEGRYNVAVEQCGVLSGAERKACMSKADAEYKADEALATANRDADLVVADKY